MNTITLSLIAFACVFGGALLGLLLRAALPEHHLGADSKDIVKLAMGLVGTMAALVLGLLVASAKSSFDNQSAELTGLSANVVLLDRVLAHYGPETKEARELLRNSVTRVLETMWSKEMTSSSPAATLSTRGDALYDNVQGLSPQNDRQRALQAQALSLMMATAQTRWLMYEQRTASVSVPLLVVLVLWLTIMLASFGLYAPANGTVIGSLFLCALSVSAAIFLILEMYAPYTGIVRVSDAALRAALANLGAGTGAY